MGNAVFFPSPQLACAREGNAGAGRAPPPVPMSAAAPGAVAARRTPERTAERARALRSRMEDLRLLAGRWTFRNNRDRGARRPHNGPNTHVTPHNRYDEMKITPALPAPSHAPSPPPHPTTPTPPSLYA
ncbi:hypothetical protein GCM10020254_53280 [Streptomyces goshikiensis]